MRYHNSWNRAEPRSLARFVPTDLGESQVVLPRSALDFVNRPNGRAELVRALYDGFMEAEVQYALEAWSPDDREQTIRPPSEILDGPRKGTCLDLALLFAAQCLSVKLLPVIVVTRTHAFVLVSLEVDANEIDAYRRTDGQRFTQGEVTDCHDWLAGLVDTGAYLAVETTGFAHVTSLDPDTIIGAGRIDGRMPFAQAREAGRRHLDSAAHDQVEFALDLAWAHAEGIVPQFVWPESSFRVADFAGQPTEHGIRLDRDPRTTWGTRRRAMVIHGGHIVGRGAEKRVLQTIAPGEVVGVHGVGGMGKSSLLKWLGNEVSAGLDDATIFLRHSCGGPLDILQEAFERCFDSDRQVSIADATEALGPIPGRLLVDDIDGLSELDIQTVSDALGRWGIAVSGTAETAKSFGTVTSLKPLAPHESVEVFERQAGPLSTDLRAQMVTALADLDITPGRMVALARSVTIGERTVDAVVEALSSPADADLGGDVADLLRAAAPAYVPAELIHHAVSGGRIAVAKDLSDLVAGGFAETGSPRYRWLRESVRSAPAEGKLVDAVLQWIHDPATSPDQIAGDRGLVLRAAFLAESHGRPTDVLELARTADAPLVASRRWGAWGELLGRAQIAATALGDTSSLAWTQHQLGTRSLGLGDTADAQQRLRWARDTRSWLGEHSASAVSQHNLDLLPPAGLALDGDGPVPDPHGRPTGPGLAPPRPHPSRPPVPVERAVPVVPSAMDTPRPRDDVRPPAAGWVRRHPIISALLGIIAVLVLLCLLGLCDDDDPPDEVLPAVVTPTPVEPSATPVVVLVPTFFACSLDTAQASAGDEIVATVGVEPEGLGLSVTVDAGPLAREFSDSGEARLVFEEAGSYDVSASWVLAGESGTTLCGTAEIISSDTESQLTGGCEVTSTEVTVLEVFFVTASYEPASLDPRIVVEHGFSELADEEGKVGGFYREAGVYVPTITFMTDTQSIAVDCPEITVSSSSSDLEPTLRGRCEVRSTQLVVDEDFQITARYEPASLNPEIVIDHGDGTREPADENGQAEGFYESPGVYTPRITFTTGTQTVSVECPKILAVAASEPPPAPQCPAGFDLLDGACVRFVAPLEVLPVPIAYGCDLGELVGTQCVIIGLPPVPGASICPVSDSVFGVPGGCYTIVDRVDGQCPAGTVEDSGSVCRRPVDTVPGPLECPEVFGLVDGKCLNYQPAFVTEFSPREFICPARTTGSPTSADDFCRETRPAS